MLINTHLGLLYNFDNLLHVYPIQQKYLNIDWFVVVQNGFLKFISLFLWSLWSVLVIRCCRDDVCIFSFLLESLTIFLAIILVTNQLQFSSLLVPAVQGTDPGPFGHAGPEPEQEFFTEAWEPCSRDEWPLPPHVTQPRSPKAEHNAGDRGSQVRAEGQMVTAGLMMHVVDFVKWQGSHPWCDKLDQNCYLPYWKIWCWVGGFSFSICVRGWGSND